MPKTPTIAMIPSGYKERVVFSVLPVNGSGDLEFVRDSKATRKNPMGVVETMANFVPRLDYENFLCPALLLEPERTNYFKNSEGTDIQTTPIGDFGFFNTEVVSNTSIPSGEVCVDFLVKKSDNTEPDVVVKIGDVTISGDFSLLANGFYNFKAKYNVPSNVTSVTITPSNNVIFGKVQVERGSYYTSYIKTEGTETTRLKDECFKGGLFDYINSEEGVIYFEGNSLVNGSGGVISLSDETQTNNVSLSFDDTPNSITFAMNNATINTDIFNQKGKMKVALMYEKENLRAFINGNFIGFNDTANSVEGLSFLKFSSFDGDNDFIGRVENLSIYNEKMTDKELVDLTTTEIVTERVIYYGSVAVKPTTSEEVTTLDSVTNPFDNKLILNTEDENTIFCFWLPVGVILSSVIDFDSLNANITISYDSEPFVIEDPEEQGSTINGNLYTMTQGVPYDNNHRHEITIL